MINMQLRAGIKVMKKQIEDLKGTVRPAEGIFLMKSHFK